MNRRIATLAAAAVFVAGVAIAPAASAGSNVAVSIGLPGLAVGYFNSGFGFVAAAPAPYFAPTPVVVAPYYRPWIARPYFYRPPVRVGFYGHARHY